MTDLEMLNYMEEARQSLYIAGFALVMGFGGFLAWLFGLDD